MNFSGGFSSGGFRGGWLCSFLNNFFSYVFDDFLICCSWCCLFEGFFNCFFCWLNDSFFDVFLSWGLSLGSISLNNFFSCFIDDFLISCCWCCFFDDFFDSFFSWFNYGLVDIFFNCFLMNFSGGCGGFRGGWLCSFLNNFQLLLR